MVGALEHGEVGHDHVHHVAARQRQGAFGDELGIAVLGDMLHHHDDLLHPGDQVHRAAHALHHLARDHPIGDVPPFGDFHRTQHGQVDMAAADHGEAGRAVEIGRMRQLADRLLAGIDQVGIDLVVIREGADAQHPVLGLQGDVHAFGDMVGHQRRDADAEVDVEAVLQLLRGARRHLVARPALGQSVMRGHQAASLSLTVRNSIFFS